MQGLNGLNGSYEWVPMLKSKSHLRGESVMSRTSLLFTVAKHMERLWETSYLQQKYNWNFHFEKGYTGWIETGNSSAWLSSLYNSQWSQNMVLLCKFCNLSLWENCEVHVKISFDFGKGHGLYSIITTAPSVSHSWLLNNTQPSYLLDSKVNPLVLLLHYIRQQLVPACISSIRSWKKGLFKLYLPVC